MPRPKLLALTTAAAVAATALTVAGLRVPRPAEAAAGDGSPGGKDVIVQLFEWRWADVASECTTVLGPAGFGAVQVSPPQEHVLLAGRRYPWWQDYQPVSYRLDTRRGSRADFAAMVTTCHAAGVKVYADAVINHMTGGASAGNGPGSAGSSYTQYAYPAVPYGTDDFHHCGRNGNDDIRNWTDRWEVQNCELLDLADLKTESDHVRDTIAGYLNDLLSLGVDGFRIDAAKHIPVADLQAIYARLTRHPYLYHEVVEGGPGEISPTEYTAIGDVTEFRYGTTVGNAFHDAHLDNLANLPNQMLLGGDDAVVFVDNHDTQRNNRAPLTYKGGTPYALAEAFMLAYPYGTPKVMSSYSFTDPDQGPPAGPDGTTSPVSCGNGWVCEHRWRTTVNLVGFHNAVAGTGLTQWWSNGGVQLAFGRGAKGYVVFNRDGTALTRTFSTDLPAGTYCDVANGDFTGGSCTGPTYTVDGGGRFTATVAANSMLALHVGARTTGGGPTGGPCPSVSVTFNETATTYWGQNVFVTGSVDGLGDWAPPNAVALSAAGYPTWSATVSLPPDTDVQYKYVKKNPDGSVTWESDPNRSLHTGSACTLTRTDTWR